jgi:anti-anti-sigma factor
MNDPPCRCLIVEAVGDVTIVRLRHRDEIDSRSDKYEYTDEVGEELYRLADRPGRHRILLDLANFETLSHPAELAKLMSLLQKVKRSGGKLKLLCRSSTYPEIFRITRLDQVYEFYEDEVMALNSSW